MKGKISYKKMKPILAVLTAAVLMLEPLGSSMAVCAAEAVQATEDERAQTGAQASEENSAAEQEPVKETGEEKEAPGTGEESAPVEDAENTAGDDDRKEETQPEDTSAENNIPEQTEEETSDGSQADKAEEEITDGLQKDETPEESEMVDAPEEEADPAIEEEAAAGGEEPVAEEISAEMTAQEDASDVPALAASDNIASGEVNEYYGHITWVIDSYGKLTVNGTGDFGPPSERGNRVPWSASDVRSAEINVSGMTNASYMFSDCKYMKSLDLSNFDTSHVTDMSGMFYQCSGLEEIHFGEAGTTKFDTSHVTDMSRMFDYCLALKSVDLSAFDTASLKNMECMFQDCSSLEKVEFGKKGVTKFDTSHVTDMSAMFDNCKVLTQVNVNVFDTSSVINMAGMFSGCNALADLDVSCFNTSSVTNMRSMFSGCKALTSLDVSNFDTSNVIFMNGMFSSCSSLANIDVSGFHTSNVTDMRSMFNNCKTLTSLNLSSFNTGNVTTLGSMFSSCTALTSLDLSSFDTSNVTDMGEMFSGCSSLISVNLSSFCTSNVTSFNNTFRNCSSLVSLDLSSFDLSACKSTSTINFLNCNSLELIYTPYNNPHSLYLPTADSTDKWYGSNGHTYTSVSANMEYSIVLKKNVVPDEKDRIMCTGSTVVGTGISTGKIDLKRMSSISGISSYSNRDVKLEGDIAGTGVTDNFGYLTLETPELSYSMHGKNVYDYNINIYCKLDDGTWAGTPIPCTMKVSVRYDGDVCGRYKDLWWGIDKDGNLTIDGTGDAPTSGTYVGQWWSTDSSFTRWKVKTAEVHVSGATNAARMFDGCKNMTSVDLSDFDTSNVTDMSYMFYGCDSLTDVDFGSKGSTKFDTSGVKNMNSMFYGCGVLTGIDLSVFDTSNVTDMSWMFENCKALERLDLSNFDTSNVKDMSSMFYLCESLAEVDFGENGISKFTASGVRDMSGMFGCCKALNRLDLSNFDTANVLDMSRMFSECASLETIDFGKKGVSKFNASEVRNMNNMFNGCKALTSLNLSTFDTSNAGNMSDMFQGCEKLKRVVFDTLEIANVTSMEGMFSSCTALEEIGFGGSGTGGSGTSSIDNIDMSCMFLDCETITSLDLTGLGKVKPCDASLMFYGCTKLKSLDLSGFDVSDINVNSYYSDKSSAMFNDCESLELVYVPRLGRLKNLPGEIWYCADGRTYDQSILPEQGNKVAATKNYILSVSGKINESYGNISWKIEGNAGSRKLTVEGTGDFFDTENTDSNSYRYSPWHDYSFGITSAQIGVSGITRVDISRYYEHYGFFSDCENLLSVDVSGFDIAKVDSLKNLFSGCKSLTEINFGQKGTTKFNTSNVTDMTKMFSDSTSLINLDLGIFITDHVECMEEMFSGCSGLKSLDLSSFNTSTVGDMFGMFAGCSGLTSLDLSSFDTSAVYIMNEMFSGCSGLTSLDLSSFNTSTVEDMDRMFSDCSSLESLNLNNFSTGMVLGFSSMFENCSSLTELDLSSFELNEYCSAYDMFRGCTKLGVIKTPRNCKAENVQLPKDDKTGAKSPWYLPDGSTTEYLPILNKSIVLKRNVIIDENDIVQYTVTFNSMGGTAVDPMKVDAKKTAAGEYAGYLSTVPQPEKEGYVFKGWFADQDGTGTALGTDTPITGDVTYYAKWEVKTGDTPGDQPGGTVEEFTVTFIVDGKEYASKKVAKDAKAEEPTAPTKDGYEFLGWYDGETKYDFTKPVTADLKLTAKWKEKEGTPAENQEDGVTWEKTDILIKVKGKQQLSIDGTKYPGRVTWKTSDKKVATVTKKGKVTAKGGGVATITAYVDGKAVEEYKIRVYQFTKLTFGNNKTSFKDTYTNTDDVFDEKDLVTVTISVGQKNAWAKAEALMKDQKLDTPAAKSGKLKVAEVKSVALKGDTITLTVQPKKKGSAKITVKFGGKTAAYTLKVK